MLLWGTRSTAKGDDGGWLGTGWSLMPQVIGRTTSLGCCMKHHRSLLLRIMERILLWNSRLFRSLLLSLLGNSFRIILRIHIQQKLFSLCKIISIPVYFDYFHGRYTTYVLSCLSLDIRNSSCLTVSIIYHLAQLISLSLPMFIFYSF